MRVMVVVMVPGRHETTTVREPIWTVKLEIAIANISFVDERSRSRFRHAATARPMLKYRLHQ